MVFTADIAFALELIALGLGTILLIWVKQGEKAGNLFAKIIGFVIIIGSILALLCTSYYSLRYWSDGYFKAPHSMGSPHGMMGGMGMGGMGMGSMMGEEMDCPMCRKRQLLREHMKEEMKEMKDRERKPSPKREESSPTP